MIFNFDKHKKYKIYFWTGVLLVTILVWSFIFIYGTDGKLKVYFLNVGQGDAIFIETPEKFQILIDGGPDNSVLSELSKIMPFYDRKIDLLILTHPQKDHIFGLIEVLKRYEVDNILFSSIEYKNSFYNEFQKLIKKKKINKIEAKAGVQLSLGEFASFDVLYPFSDMSGVEVDNPNNTSLALVLKFLDKKFLFSGDAELKEELNLANSGLDVDIDVLKVNHHGSKTSSSVLFLEKTSPEISVISVGENNLYKHPSDVVLKRLENTKILRTDLNGTISIITDGFKLNYKTEF